MNYMETGKASILASIDPVCAGVWGWLLYQERPDWIMVLGMVVVLFGVTILNFPEGIKTLLTWLPGRRGARTGSPAGQGGHGSGE
jgi:drug/metabolite transporter (DMT)-like permease